MLSILANMSLAADPLDDDYYELNGPFEEVEKYLRVIIAKFDEGLHQASDLSSRISDVKETQIDIQNSALKAEYDRQLIKLEQASIKKRTNLLEERGKEQSEINQLLSEGLKESLKISGDNQKFNQKLANSAKGWGKFLLGIVGTVIAGLIQRKYFHKRKKKA